MGMTPAQYMEKVEQVTLQQVVDAANTVQLHSSFFLKGVSA
jgi:predicted Zn-dependent peptidase